MTDHSQEIQQAISDVQYAATSGVGEATITVINYYYHDPVDLPGQKFSPVNQPAEKLVCPYRGLLHFRPEDSENFFGRGLVVQELVKAVERQKFVAVLGASGSGKSSVVLAGLVPALQHIGNWRFTHFRPGTDPFYNLALALVPLYVPADDATDRLTQARKLANNLQNSTLLLPDVLSQIRRESHQQRLLLIADQFEELYTHCPLKEPQTRFLDTILPTFSAAATTPPTVVLAVTMRADFLSQALAHRDFADMLQNQDFKLGAMAPDELRQTIEQPAINQGVAFEAGLVDRILNDVKGEPGNLPLLEFALTALWQHCHARQLTHATYEAIGQVKGALALYAEECFDALTPAEQEQAKRVFVQLVNPVHDAADTRRLATRDEVGETHWNLVQKLANYRLVVTTEDVVKHESVEVVHEALIRNWKRLKDWMSSDFEFRSWQERLRFKLEDWERTHHEEEALLAGTALTEAEAWLEQRSEDLSSPERAFIQQSIDCRDRRLNEKEARQQRELRRAQRIAFAASLGGAIMAILAGLAFTQWQVANQQREVAQLNELNALIQTAEAKFALNPDTLDTLDASLAAGERLRAIMKDQVAPEAEVQVLKVVSQAVNWVTEQHRWQGHSNDIQHVSYSPDGEYLVTSSFDRTARLWRSTGELVRSLEGHTDAVIAASFSPDGQKIATVSTDQSLRIWNLNGQEIAQIKDDARIASVDFAVDGNSIVTGNEAGAVKLWSLNETALTASKPLTQHDNSVYEVAFSLDMQTIATASGDGNARLISPNGEIIHNLFHGGVVRTVAFSPDGQTIITGGDDHTIKQWDRAQGICQRSWLAHRGAVTSLKYSLDGQTIASASDDESIKVWAITGASHQEFELHQEFEGHAGRVNAVNFHPAGELLASVANDNTVRLWRLNGPWTTVLHNGLATVWDVSLSPDQRTIAAASDDGMLRLWSIDSILPHVDQQAHQGGALQVNFSPDGKTIVSAGADNTVKLWTATGQFLRALSHPGWIYDASFSPDGTLIATADYDGRIWLWRTDGVLQKEFMGHPRGTYKVRFSPDGTQLASAGADGLAKLWTSTGELLTEFTGHSSDVHSVHFAPTEDGTLVTTGEDETVRVWSRSGQLLLTLKEAGLEDVQFSPDGQLIASSTPDGSIKLWSKEGDLINTLVGHQEPVTGLSFSTDGQILASSSEDNTVIVWTINDLTLEGYLRRGCQWMQPYLKSSQLDNRENCKDVFEQTQLIQSN